MTDATSSPAAADQPFLMRVEDVFAFPTGGIVAAGRILRGTVRVGHTVEIIGLREDVLSSMVIGISVMRLDRDRIDRSQGLEQRGIYVNFRELSKEDVQLGQVIAAPGTIRPYSTFLADVIFSNEKEATGQQPKAGAYHTQFHIWAGTVSGTL